MVISKEIPLKIKKIIWCDEKKLIFTMEEKNVQQSAMQTA